jgi:hypothetical protein
MHNKDRLSNSVDLVKLQNRLPFANQVERAHLQNLASLLDDNNDLELEKLYYSILSDAALIYQRDPTLEGSYLTIDPAVSVVYFRRNKCPTVWKSSSRDEYDILYEIVCRLTEKFFRDFLLDVWIGTRPPIDLPVFL